MSDQNELEKAIAIRDGVLKQVPSGASVPVDLQAALDRTNAIIAELGPLISSRDNLTASIARRDAYAKAHPSPDFGTVTDLERARLDAVNAEITRLFAPLSTAS